MLAGGSPFRDLREGLGFGGMFSEWDAFTRSFPRLERCRHKDARLHDPKLRIDINTLNLTFTDLLKTFLHAVN
jgi:hypothetical protein